MELPHLSTCLIAVALREGPLQLYQGKKLVDVIPTGDTISAVRFGHLGQEENVLVIITRGGTLMFKILKRTADFKLSNVLDSNNEVFGDRPPQTALPLPKRSRLFAEQAQRERENTLSIHHSFQQDLIRLRLTTARQTVRNIDTSGLAITDRQPVRLSAQVLGLGPRFSLILTLENVSSEKSVSDLTVVFHADSKFYAIATPFVQVSDELSRTA